MMQATAILHLFEVDVVLAIHVDTGVHHWNLGAVTFTNAFVKCIVWNIVQLILIAW